MNYESLHSEITNDPAEVGYSTHVVTGNDSAIADLLNAPHGAPVVGLVDIQSVQAELHKMTHASGMPVWVLIEDTADNAEADPGVRVACRMIKVVATSKYQNVDLSLPVVAGVLDAITLASILTPSQRESLDQLASRSRSRAESVLGDGVVVSHLDVAKALRG